MSEHNETYFWRHASDPLKNLVHCGMSIDDALKALPRRKVEIQPSVSKWNHSYTITDASTREVLGFVNNPSEVNHHRYDAQGYYIVDYKYTEWFVAEE